MGHLSRPRFRNPFDTEEQVAALVREALELAGWEVHPECNGWDLFAVMRGPSRQVLDGDTLGVECKLDGGRLAGFESLLRQSVPWPRRPWGPGGFGTNDYFAPAKGPHYRAVAAPRIAGQDVFRNLGIATWVVARSRREIRTWEWGPWRQMEAAELAPLPMGIRFSPKSPPQVPEIVVDVPAGVPSPQTSTPWKLKAVRMMLRLRNGEDITSSDFRAADLSVTRFRECGWISDTGRRLGRSYVWGPGEGSHHCGLPPDLQWPQIAEALRARDQAR